MITETLYQKAREEIDRVHSLDQTIQTENNIEFPAELLYSKRMLETLQIVNTDSSYAMKIAALCQHLKRWQIPRDNYPYNRRGYHEWRRVVLEFQVELTSNILKDIDMDKDDIFHIIQILQEQGNKLNRESQILMDTACLVFLKWYMEPFALKHPSEKVTDILKKTVRKMSSHGLQLIPRLDLNISSKQLLEQAIS